jgi:hypothetical protein
MLIGDGWTLRTDVSVMTRTRKAAGKASVGLQEGFRVCLSRNGKSHRSLSEGHVLVVANKMMDPGLRRRRLVSMCVFSFREDAAVHLPLTPHALDWIRTVDLRLPEIVCVFTMPADIVAGCE